MTWRTLGQVLMDSLAGAVWDRDTGNGCGGNRSDARSGQSNEIEKLGTAAEAEAVALVSGERHLCKSANDHEGEDGDDQDDDPADRQFNQLAPRGRRIVPS